MADNQVADPVELALIALSGRKLAMREIYECFSLSSTQYAEVRREGKLARADRLVHAARNLDINPVELLVTCGTITLTEAVNFVERKRCEAQQFWDATQQPQA